MPDEKIQEISSLLQMNSLLNELNAAFIAEKPRSETEPIAKRIIAKGTDVMPHLFSMLLKDQRAVDIVPDYKLIADIYEAFGRKGLNFIYDKLQSVDKAEIRTGVELISFGEYKSAYSPLLELLDRMDQRNMYEDYTLQQMTNALHVITPREKRAFVASRLVDSLVNFIEFNSTYSAKGHCLSAESASEFQQALYQFGDVLPGIIRARLNEMKKNPHIRSVLAGLRNEIINNRSMQPEPNERVDNKFAAVSGTHVKVEVQPLPKQMKLRP